LSVSKTKIRLNRSLPVFKIETILHTIENNIQDRNKTYKTYILVNKLLKYNTRAKKTEN
jgi:hypothetical protein